MVKGYTKEYLIKTLQKKAQELGRPPRSREINQTTTMSKYFGSYNKALIAAGLNPTHLRYTKGQLIKILKQKAAELGRAPRQQDVEQYRTIVKHFGSFNKGLIAAGLSPIVENKPYKHEELISILQQNAKKLNRSPRFDEIKQRHTIVKHFGSFNNALKMAGLLPNKERSKMVYTKEDLIEILQQKAKELGRTPKMEEIKQKSSIVKYFGRYGKALEVAGLSPNKRGRKQKA
ncbi:homing endonuclease associated repeat-containing protein [Bacillus sonorensis]|uniref:homing endonuclease associated repeat-containing protein n=1 Tax=Bacillus sonorensis TaxID=119858 RepID=UPI002DB57323|nr:hypothetical protein [Bacillus sonorensis]MEC0341950.1 hypothetical protein [Bacillus sonorensis]MEC0457365.1 hypothetical protein [Bacillus sonorensis]MEC0530669.1 hypothetical protein [Bacillus sonorensis]